MVQNTVTAQILPSHLTAKSVKRDRKGKEWQRFTVVLDSTDVSWHFYGIFALILTIEGYLPLKCRQNATSTKHNRKSLPIKGVEILLTLYQSL